MLLPRMTLVSFGLFRKKLGNVQECLYIEKFVDINIVIISCVAIMNSRSHYKAFTLVTGRWPFYTFKSEIAHRIPQITTHREPG